MANAHTHYGRLLLTREDIEPSSMPLAAPVDDLLAFGNPETPERTIQYVYRYIAAFPRPDLGAGDYNKLVARILRPQVRDDFLRAARSAARGKLPKEIIPHLSRITFRAGDVPDDVPDVLALAAWSLDRLMREQPFRVKKCALCKVPFLSSGRSRYCRRMAPGSLKQSCLEAGKLRDFRSRQRAKKEDDRG